MLKARLRIGKAVSAPIRLRTVLGGHHPLDLGDDLPKVDGFGQDLGPLWRAASSRQSDCGETCDEHYAGSRRARGRLPSDLNAIGARHDDVRQKEIVGTIVERPYGLVPIRTGSHLVTRPFEGAG